MSAKITLFDFASNEKLGGSNWNPNVFKTRITLGYKGIPFTTTFIEYTEIQKTLAPLGAVAPKKADGTDSWTLPAILYESAEEKKVIIDSFEIAKFLDEKYPDTPKITELVLSDGKNVKLGATAGVFEERWIENLKKVFPPMMGYSIMYMNPGSEGYFRSTREPMLGGKRLEEHIPADGAKDAETWVAFATGLQPIAAFYARNAGGDWFLGENFTFVDVIPLAYLSWMKTAVGAESEEWKLVESAAGGFWKTRLEKADKWILREKKRQ